MSLASGAANAALHDRGGGLVYDDVLDVTWLQDANYAKTSGYDSDGLMTWSEASTWAENLVYGGYDDWRLPNKMPVGAEWNYDFSYDGTTDIGFNIKSPHSELSYMYYVNLGLDGYYSQGGVFQPTWGIYGNGTLGGQANVGLMDNVQSGIYWTGTAYAPDPTVYAWYFNTQVGSEIGVPQSHLFYAWAVRPGDVAAVPEPESYALMLAGLGLAGGAAARHRRRVLGVP